MTGTTATSYTLVDSSGWLEALTEDSKAALFKPYLLRTDRLLIPTIVIYEVYKKLLSGWGQTQADTFYSHALQAIVIDLDKQTAAGAAQISLDHKLPMADAIIYATSQSYGAELITGDPHFAGLPGVKVL